MRELNKSEHLSQIIDAFNTVVEQNTFLISWQLVNDKRVITPIYINLIDEENGSFQTAAAKDEPFDYAAEQVYFFCESNNFIFKTRLINAMGTEASFTLPNEVKMLEEQDQAPMKDLIDVFNKEKIFVEGEGRANQKFEENLVAGSGEANINKETHMRGTVMGTDHISGKESHSGSNEKIDKFRSNATLTEKISTTWAVKSMSAADTALFEEELSYITLEEEDKQFEGIRSAPRAKPPEGKMVTIQEATGERAQGSYPLYDLSRGGFSFLVFSREEFNSGETVKVIAFDTKKFEEPMFADVKSVREADQMGIQYKVGCQFVNGD